MSVTSTASAATSSTSLVFATTVAPPGSVIFSPPFSPTPDVSFTTTSSAIDAPGERPLSTTVATIGVVNPDPQSTVPSTPTTNSPNVPNPPPAQNPTPSPTRYSSVEAGAVPPPGYSANKAPNGANQPTPTPSVVVITSGSRVITITGSARPNTASAQTTSAGVAVRQGGLGMKGMVFVGMAVGAILAEMRVG